MSFFWWERVDSNHRSETQQIYSLPPLATRELSHIGAGERNRTINLLITNQLLCQLSYASALTLPLLIATRVVTLDSIIIRRHFVKIFFENY